MGAEHLKTKKPESSAKTASTQPKTLLQSAKATGVPAWTMGWANLPPSSLFSPVPPALPVQPAKFTASLPDDPLEKEADKIAEQVMKVPESISNLGTAQAYSPSPNASYQNRSAPATISRQHQAEKYSPLLQRQPSADIEEYNPDTAELAGRESLAAPEPVPTETGEGQETIAWAENPAPVTENAPEAEETMASTPEEGEAETLQKAAESSGSSAAVTPGAAISMQKTLNLPGQPLDRQTRAFMENRFGHDFGETRVHSGAQADDSAQAVQARAYTVGQDVVFRTGQYQPETAEGRKLLAHELAHVVQQTQGISRVIQREPEVTSQADIFNQVIEEAKGRLAPPDALKLTQATIRSTVQSDRTIYEIEGKGRFTFPTQIQRAQAGLYLYIWDKNPEATPLKVISLATGTLLEPKEWPLIPIVAGSLEARDLRRGAIGIINITQTVSTPAPRHEPSPSQMQISLRNEIPAGVFRRALEEYPRRPLVLPGVTGGLFQPDQTYERPLNFTHYTHDGTYLMVSRRLVERDFYYLLPINDLQTYLRFYPFEYAGKAAEAWIPISRFLVDVAISFIPIVGPLYGLGMALYTGYQAYKHWDQMSGLEKGFTGLVILVSIIPGIRAGRNIARGAVAYRQGVATLVRSGLAEAEASRLMLSAGIFQSEKSALRIVDTLGKSLENGGRLTGPQLAQAERLFNLMLQRLPLAERAVVTAGFATRDLPSIRQFFQGLELTEQHLEGLRRLTPQTLVALQKIARAEPLTVQQIATWAARSREAVRGIERLQGLVKPAHLTKVLTEAGSDLLEQLGRGGVPVSKELAALVQRARSATEAYRLLMRGSTWRGRNIPGLSAALSGSLAKELPAALLPVQAEFSHLFLSAAQLGGLARLSAATRVVLKRASDSELRAISSFIASSAEAATAIELLVTRLAPAFPAKNSYFIAKILTYMGGGVLKTAGSTGLNLSAELITLAARQRTPYAAAKMLLQGYRREVTYLPGLLETMAANLKTVTSAEKALASIEFASLRGDLFAQWALANPSLLNSISPNLAEGIALISKIGSAQAQSRISRIYSAVGGSQKEALDIFSALGQVKNMYKVEQELAPLISELAAGAEKTQGASFTLSYLSLRKVGAISATEFPVTIKALNNAARKYDLVAGGTFYEFKNWTGFGGPPALQAASEFTRDLVEHVGTNFSQLRWVISRNAEGSRTAIESMMRNVLTRPEVRKALAAQKITLEEATARLENALRGNLLEFF